MPAQPITIQKVGQGGKIIKRVERQGGVFAPVVGKGQRSVYNCGPADAPGTAKDQVLLYQCPVSAIPVEVWDLLQLWWSCRLTGLPPVAGGFLAQPVIVQLTFPIFEGMQRVVEASRQQGGAQTAASLAAAAMAKMMMGGGR